MTRGYLSLQRLSATLAAMLTGIALGAAAAPHVGTKAAIGAHCKGTDGCESGFCVDGICCNKACNGSCHVCSAEKGSSVDGLCAVASSATPGECSPYACRENLCPTSCVTDEQCLIGFQCGADHACRPKQSNGAHCGGGKECASGFCAAGICCDSSCGGACSTCSAALGASKDGVCSMITGAGVPSCAPYVCDGTDLECPQSCSSSRQCVKGDACRDGKCAPKAAVGVACATNDDCTEGRCVGGSCVSSPLTNGAACQDTSQCRSGSCADGVCCESACRGPCDRCDMPGGVGKCWPAKAGDPGSPTCAPYVCNGLTASCSAWCSSDKSCAQGFKCIGGRCDRLAENGKSCGRNDSCASGFCADGVCCETACDGACETCSASAGICTPLKAGAEAPECGAYRCDGKTGDCPTACSDDTQCQSTDYCDNGKCIVKRALGSNCSATDHCANGVCVDGVCCATACDSQCGACNLPGSRGRCSPVIGAPRGARKACEGAGATCGGHCDGVHVDVCRFPAPAVACARPGCDGDTLHPAEVCDGAGHCSAVGAVSCAPYSCGETSCLTSCDDDEDCNAQNWCQGGQCVPRLSNSVTCERDTACTSGHCADGVCCDSACDGPCDLCNLPGHAGTCSASPSGTEPNPSVCGELRCNGKTTSCPPECLSTAECKSGFTCEENRCVAKQANGQSCSRDERCVSGQCVDGVCCNSSCQGVCATCRSAETPGVCTNVSGEPLPGRGACVGDGTCEGVCDGSSPSCHYPDLRTVCGVAASCVEAVAKEASVCDGRGACLVGARHECPTGCDGVRCASATLRTDDSGCASAGAGVLACALLAVGLLLRRGARSRHQGPPEGVPPARL